MTPTERVVLRAWMTRGARGHYTIAALGRIARDCGLSYRRTEAIILRWEHTPPPRPDPFA